MKDNIEAIIFDFGGVIINIDPSLTVREFEKLAANSSLLNQVYEGFIKIHDSLEIGSMAPEIFRKRVRELFGLKHLNDHEFDKAWNALLLDIPPKRISLIERLKNKYRLFLLSNTNAIHYQKYCSDFSREFAGKTLEGLFEKAFFSFKMGLKKPDPQIFQTVIQACALSPDRTLFIDDTPEHVEAAKRCGLQAFHLKNGLDIVSLFDNAGNLAISAEN